MRRSPTPDLNPPDEGRDPTEAEEIAACLGDDAAQIRNELANCRPNGEGFIAEEWADNMEKAATLLTKLEQRAAIGDALLQHIVQGESYREFRDKHIQNGYDAPFQQWLFRLQMPAPSFVVDDRLRDSNFTFEQSLSLFIFESTGLPKEVIDAAIEEAQPHPRGVDGQVKGGG